MTELLEKEDIMADLLTRAGTHDNSPLVTEDWDKTETLEYLPMVLVVERPDLTRSIRRDSPVQYDRWGFISTLSFIKGTSGEKAPRELRTFQRKLRKVIYKDKKRRIGQNGAGIREHMASQIVFPEQGNHIVMQEILWRVDYIEDTGRLFN